MSDDDDKNCSLFQLSQHHRSPIVSQLVDIGSESNQEKHTKFRIFIEELQCLVPRGLKLHRQSIDASSEHRYVALSYTWTPSEHEDPEPGRYTVKNWDNEDFKLSNVRECVLKRVLDYMSHAKVRFLWIDAHCIRQDTCRINDCDVPPRCGEKRDAIQAMDLVYQLSEHPVALLGRQLGSKRELDVLAWILSGCLVDSDNDFLLSAETEFDQAVEALVLASQITHELWWSRAWTFQENYRGGTWMQLLIAHHESLEPHKQLYSMFGEIPGELCILSVDFSREVTRLCLALGAVTEPASDISRQIGCVLRAARRYAIILNDSSSMTPIVVADIEVRGLSKPWDRLAIVANCCQYPARLDGGELSRQGHSLSLSILAMCLLNGEILDNGKDSAVPVAALTASESLERLMFREFNAPEDDVRRLSFNKGCRLVDVKLTVDGIETRGHLWNLGRIIDTTHLPKKSRWIEDDRRHPLTFIERKCLLRLVSHLEDWGYTTLADQIEDLAIDASAMQRHSLFTNRYLYRMAAELAAAVRDKQELRLGCIRDDEYSPYSAIFLWSEQDGNEACSDFAFTSIRKRNPGSQTYDANDLDYHVSLLVNIEEQHGRDLPLLRTCNWLRGICFFENYSLTPVIFPWPQSLLSC